VEEVAPESLIRRAGCFFGDGRFEILFRFWLDSWQLFDMENPRSISGFIIAAVIAGIIYFK
jgi:hypothetical protein